LRKDRPNKQLADERRDNNVSKALSFPLGASVTQLATMTRYHFNEKYALRKERERERVGMAFVVDSD